jgi:hypothetical protein
MCKPASTLSSVKDYPYTREELVAETTKHFTSLLSAEAYANSLLTEELKVFWELDAVSACHWGLTFTSHNKHLELKVSEYQQFYSHIDKSIYLTYTDIGLMKELKDESIYRPTIQKFLVAHYPCFHTPHHIRGTGGMIKAKFNHSAGPEEFCKALVVLRKEFGI